MGQALRTHPLLHGPGPAPRHDARRIPQRAPAPLFADLVAPSRRAHGRFGLGASLVAHAAALFLLILLPVLSHEDLPRHRD